MPAPPQLQGWRALLLRPVLWLLIFGALVAYGLYALYAIPVEVLPTFNYPEISVITHEPGATATELETQIVYPIEAEILSLPDTSQLRSTMGDGVVETDVRFAQGTDPQTDLQAVNGAVDLARAAMPPGVSPYAQIMGNAINEVVDETLRLPASVDPSQAQQAVLAAVAPALRALPGVQRVDVYGAGQESLWVQPNLAALRRYGIPVTALTAALKAQVFLQPAGYLSTGHQDVFSEFRHLPTHASQLARTPVAGPNGPIPLANLARIERAGLPTLNTVLLNGAPAVALIVFKQPHASTRQVTEAVRASLAANTAALPAGARWVGIYDQGHVVRVVGADLTRNLVIGGLLAIAAVFWVLGAGSGVWVLAISIPLALLLAIAGLYITGHSLDMVTLGALTVAVGLMSDDGIIVLESIYHRWESGDGHWQGVANGVRDIASPDVVGTFTTVAVFVPLMFLGGLAGLFFLPFALAMTFALLASLLISLSLVPLSLGFAPRRARGAVRTTRAGRALDRLRRANLHIFHTVLRRPGWSIAVCVLLLLASVGGLFLIPVNFLPLPNEGVLLESYTLPPGSSMLDTEQAVDAITRRLRRDPAVANVSARIGSSASSAYTEPGYAGEIEITLRPSVNINDLTAIGKRVLGESALPGVQEGLDTPTIERVGESLSGLAQPFVLDLFGPNTSTLRALSEQITARLRAIPALSGVFNNDAYPVTELRIDPRSSALAAQHLTAAGLYAQLAPLLNGQIVAQVPEGNVSLALYIRLADAPQQSVAQLGRLPISVPAGWTPLSQLATLTLVTTPNQLHHIAGARALEILATPTGPLGSTIAAARRALAGLHRPPGYRYEFGGLYRQLERALAGLAVAAIAAFVLMVGIMVLQFDGILVPGLLLLQIPLAFTGGALLLLLSGVGLNAMGLVAFLTLIGIGLNHGIVLLYRARRNEAGGMPPRAAMEEAIHVRFRPIVLTTLTAVLGMLPTALGWGQGAAPEQGLAIVSLGGILWSALLTTNLLPALYVRRRDKKGRHRVKLRLALPAALCLLAAGCAHYRPLPLPPAPHLSPAARLTVLPRQFRLPGLRPHPLPANGLDELAVITLAVENNPDLRAARLQNGVAQAQLLQAGLLPDPVLSAGLSRSLHTGYNVGAAEPLEALILRGAARAGARAQLRAVNLDILWQEWQVGERARELFIEAREDASLTALLRRRQRLLAAAYNRDRAAMRRGDQLRTVVDADLSALTSVESSQRQVQLDALTTGQSLRALLGLSPDAPLPLLGPARPPALTAADYRSDIALLARRRPDLLALQAGYQSQEQALREAILAQFPALAVNLARSRDPIEAANTTSLGISLTLPLFNRNRGNIAIQTATRAALRRQYQARLDQAQSMAGAAWAAARLLQHQLVQLDARLPALMAAAAGARRALQAGNLNAALYVTMQSAAWSAQADAIRLRAALATNQSALDTLFAVPFRP